MLYAAAAWAASGGVARDTTVAGVDVGGLDRDAAISRLDEAAAAAEEPAPVKAGDKTATVDLTAAGLGIDTEATVDDLVGFSLSPASLWRHVTGGGEREAVETTDTARLDAALDGLADKVRVPSKDAAVRFDGTEPTVTPAVVGADLDKAAAADTLRATWLGGTRPIVLPVTETQPKVTQAAAETALRDVATPAVAGPLEVVVGAKTVSLPPAKVVPSLSLVPDDAGTLGLKVDGAKLREAVLTAAPEIGVVPKDARIELRNGRPVVVPAVAGVTIDATALAEAARPALAAADRERRATVETAVREPELTTAEAQKLGVKEQVSTFATNLTSDSRRTENLRIAARTVNGTLVMPGETFSLNGVLGERTPAKGYNQAPAISGGRLVRDFGGGVSQMATTIFNNVFFAGLDDVYHKPHSFYISRYPEGREATVNWPSRRPQVEERLAVRRPGPGVGGRPGARQLLEHEGLGHRGQQERPLELPVAGDHPRRQPGLRRAGGERRFDVSVRRIFKKNGAVVKTETFNTTYIAEDKVICGPKPPETEEPGTD